MSDKRNDRISWQEHSRRRRGSNSPCVACSSLPRLREASGQVPGNRDKRRYLRSGCYECNVSLCNSDNCWYYFRTQNYLVNRSTDRMRFLIGSNFSYQRTAWPQPYISMYLASVSTRWDKRYEFVSCGLKILSCNCLLECF
jgi:hypothetical protein